MHWRLKGGIQKVLGVVPYGERLHYRLQRAGGGLANFERELGMKIEDWTIMAENLRKVGVPVTGTSFMEMGSGWFPTFPFSLYLGGARSIDTLDLNRHMRPDLTLMCAKGLERAVEPIAAATGQEAAAVHERQRGIVAALERGVAVDEATRGAVRYRAPADAAATGLPAGSVDVVFSNSVLEHVPPGVIEKCFEEAMRVLRPGGIVFHSVNCGDHYAYVDRNIGQLHYLRYSDEAWGKWNNAFLYQNRLRAVDFLDMARAAGFVIELDTSVVRPNRLAELDRIDVDPRFARYTREQLAITSIDFVGRKPSKGSGNGAGAPS